MNSNLQLLLYSIRSCTCDVVALSGMHMSTRQRTVIFSVAADTKIRCCSHVKIMGRLFWQLKSHLRNCSRISNPYAFLARDRNIEWEICRSKLTSTRSNSMWRHVRMHHEPSKPLESNALHDISTTASIFEFLEELFNSRAFRLCLTTPKNSRSTQLIRRTSHIMYVYQSL